MSSSWDLLTKCNLMFMQNLFTKNIYNHLNILRKLNEEKSHIC